MSTVQHFDIKATDQDGQVNLTLFKSRLQAKREELIPLVSFYEDLREGWENRVAIAETALRNIKNISAEDRAKLKELMEIAHLEIQRIDDTFLETSKISDDLWRKIQDLDMLTLRQSSEVQSVNVKIDIDSINQVFHQADALIELRQNKIKELTS